MHTDPSAASPDVPTTARWKKMSMPRSCTAVATAPAAAQIDDRGNGDAGVGEVDAAR